ncbi:MAG: hypothetical protein U9N85_12280 [Bacteroidota bacterium]|nr:hypothetical protein [Bacteroidota bacterium]
MTAQDIIRQTEKLSPDEQKSLISFLVLKYINPNEKQNLMQLFHYQNDFEKIETKDTSNRDNLKKALEEFRGKGKNFSNGEDAQIYINKLREDDRGF